MQQVDSRTEPEQATDETSHNAAGPVRFGEFILLISGLMSLTALSIDIMLPALAAIGRDFQIVDENQRQYVVTLYLAGFAAGQIVYGPLSDRFGRKPILLLGLGLYAFASLTCLFADRFDTLLAARTLQGFANASSRVLAVAIVRDLYGGRRMAEVMSFVMMVFIIIPILAPSIGSLILLAGEWHLIFTFLAFASMALATAVALRLPETHPVAAREPLSAIWLLQTARLIATTPQTLGYALATGLLLGALMSYVATSQQVFIDVYHTGKWFPVLFGATASALALASFINSRLVMRLGMRRISHMALICFLAVAAAHLALDRTIGAPDLPLFIGLLSLNLLCFGLIMPNFNALAMEPMGRVAGTASSFVGALTTGLSAALSSLIGSLFDGSVTPLLGGIAGCGFLALAVVLATERGRLFHVLER